MARGLRQCRSTKYVSCRSTSGGAPAQRLAAKTMDAIAIDAPTARGAVSASPARQESLEGALVAESHLCAADDGTEPIPPRVV